MFMKASSVSVWKDALLKLSDKHFFNLVRLYLGPVKTPFSKQKLADSLAAFLRKPEVRKNILAALDGLDLKLITGVFVLTEPDRMKLVRLFSGEYSFPELYDRILNLEERLLIFRTGESSSSGYRVNPYLEEDLRGLADFSCLFSSGGRELSPAEEGFFSGAVPASDNSLSEYFFRRPEKAFPCKKPGRAACPGCFCMEGIRLPSGFGENRMAVRRRLMQAFRAVGYK